MRFAQVIAYGADGQLAELLREVTQQRGAWLRPVSRPATCLGLLRKNPASIVVLKLGTDLEKELALLQRCSEQFPAAATLVVGHTEHPPLAALAWDLGARFVLFPPQPSARLRDLLVGLLQES